MKLIKRIKNRIRRWNAWRKNGAWKIMGPTYHIRVLLGLKHSPSFEYFILPDEYPNVRNMYHGVDMINNEAFESAKALGASFDNAYKTIVELNEKGESE